MSIINYNNIKCQSCYEIPDIPFICYYCNNLICKDCFDMLKLKNALCPFCKKILNCIPNELLREILNSKIIECNNCHEKITQNNYIKHQEKCRIFKCKICQGKFKNYNNFFQHFNDEVHKKIIIYIMNENNENKEYLGDFQKEIEELSETRAQFEELENKINEIKKKNDEESEIHSFLNLVGRIEKNPEFKLNENKDDEYSLIQIPIIPKTNCYKDNFMDLFFCNKRTYLKCECKYKICAPTCCMCEECLKINQEYHKLNETNLINKAGRTAFCRYGKFHCLYQYKVKEEKNKNFFYIFKICVPENICEACNHLNINANIYLNEKILEELHFVQNSEKK